MKYSNVALFATGALAAGPSIVKRDISQVGSDVTAISASAAALDSAIGTFTGPADRQSLLDASGNVVTAINKATSDTGDIADGSINLNNVTPLLNPVTSLGTVVGNTVDDLVGKKNQFASFGFCPDVLSQVEAQQSAANSFISALIPKLDSTLSAQAALLAGPITSALDSASAAFTSCPAASTSPTTSSPVTTSTETTSSGSTGSTLMTSSSGSSGSTSSGSVTTTSFDLSFTSTPGTTIITGTVPSSTSTPGEVSGSTTVTTPITSPTPSSTLVPNNPNAGARQVAGLGGILAAAVAVVAAL